MYGHPWGIIGDENFKKRVKKARSIIGTQGTHEELIGDVWEPLWDHWG